MDKIPPTYTTHFPKWEKFFYRHTIWTQSSMNSTSGLWNNVPSIGDHGVHRPLPVAWRLFFEWGRQCWISPLVSSFVDCYLWSCSDLCLKNKQSISFKVNINTIKSKTEYELKNDPLRQLLLSNLSTGFNINKPHMWLICKHSTLEIGERSIIQLWHY